MNLVRRFFGGGVAPSNPIQTYKGTTQVAHPDPRINEGQLQELVKTYFLSARRITSPSDRVKEDWSNVTQFVQEYGNLRFDEGRAAMPPQVVVVDVKGLRVEDHMAIVQKHGEEQRQIGRREQHEASIGVVNENVSLKEKLADSESKVSDLEKQLAAVELREAELTRRLELKTEHEAELIKALGHQVEKEAALTKDRQLAYAIYRQRPDENDGVEFFYGAMGYPTNDLDEGERLVAGWFVPDEEAQPQEPEAEATEAQPEEPEPVPEAEPQAEEATN